MRFQFTFCLPALLLLQGATPSRAQATPGALSHSVILVDAAPRQCTVEGSTYNTPFDCAVAEAKAWTRRTQIPISLQLGSGTYETRLGLQMTPAERATIGISGRGKGEFGGGTVLKLVAPLSTAVVSYSFLDPSWNSGYWSNLRLDGFTIDANGNAPMCLDLYALRVAHLTDLSCTSATGRRAWVRIGGYGEDIGGTVPKGKQGLAFQVIASDLFLYNPTTGPGAVVKPVVQNGGLAGFKIEDPGIYRQSGPVAVLLKGESAGAPVCDTMPSGLRGLLTPDPQHPGLNKLTRITVETPGAGCRPNLHIAVPDLPPAAYGFELAATDSTFYDLTDDGVGATAGIVDRGSDGSVFYHPHAWNVVDMFDAWGHDAIVDPEIDSVYAYGIRVRYGDSTTITRPSFIYLPHAAYAAVGDIHFDPGSRKTRISDPVCLSRNPNEGYAQLSGPRGAFVAGYGTGREIPEVGVPAGLDIRGNRSCAPAPPMSALLDVEPGSGDTAVSGRELRVTLRNRGKTSAAPFLLAILPPIKQETTAASLRVTIHSGPLQEIPEDAIYVIANLATGPKVTRSPDPSIHRAAHPLLVYRQPDGSLAIYADAQPHTSTAVTIDLVQNDSTLLLPEPLQTPVRGSLVAEEQRAPKVGLER